MYHFGLAITSKNNNIMVQTQLKKNEEMTETKNNCKFMRKQSRLKYNDRSYKYIL